MFKNVDLLAFKIVIKMEIYLIIFFTPFSHHILLFAFVLSD